MENKIPKQLIEEYLKYHKVDLPNFKAVDIIYMLENHGFKIVKKDNVK